MDITVIRDGKKFTFPGKENISLSEQLREQKIYIGAPCGGGGKCGKCKVQMIAGASDVTESDRRFLKESELEQGWRLACTAYPDEDCTIAVCSGEESEFEVISVYEETAEAGTAGRTRAVMQAEPAVEAGKDNSYGVGIDIGTTTIVLQLVGETSGRILHTVTMVNRQRSFGADVISRIQASNEGNKEALQDCIRRDLYEGMKHLIRESDTDGEKIARIVIAANTTMGHLLMGYSCETLGVYPFTPVNISRITTGFSEMFAGQQQEDGEEALDIDAEIILLPGISAYVGADIAAGMLVCDFDKREKPMSAH